MDKLGLLVRRSPDGAKAAQRITHDQRILLRLTEVEKPQGGETRDHQRTTAPATRDGHEGNLPFDNHFRSILQRPQGRNAGAVLVAQG